MSPAHKTPRLRLAVLVGALGLAGLVSGCGKVGLLDQPAPLFGERARERYDTEQAQRQRDAADKVAGRTAASTAAADVPDSPNKPDNAPKTTRDIKAPEQKNTPLSRDPIDGVPNPLGPSASPNPPG